MPFSRKRAVYDPAECHKCRRKFEDDEVLVVVNAQRWCKPCWSKRDQELRNDASAETTQKVGPAANGRVIRKRIGDE